MTKKLIIAFIVFTAVGLGLFYLLTMGNVGVEYDTVQVTRGQVGKYVEDVGQVSSKNIRSYYGNGTRKVEKMNLEVGDPVKAGQVLIKFEDNLDLEIQKIQKQIEALEAVYNEALTGTDVASVNSARIEISKARSSLDSAKKTKDRTQTLYDSGAASLMELEDAVESVDQLQSALGIAQNAYNKLTKEISENNKNKYEAEIDVLILSLEILEKSRDLSFIYADVDGIVTEVNTFEGDMPSPGVLILEVYDPSEKVILVDFMVEDAKTIKEGMQAEIDDFDLDVHRTDLKVDKVHPKAFISLSELSVEENRQTVEIGLPSDADLLAFGVELSMKVMVEPERESLFVPIASVINEKSKHYVELLIDGELVRREILTGTRFEKNIEVLEGLSEGDQVILNYQED